MTSLLVLIGKLLLYLFWTGERASADVNVEKVILYGDSAKIEDFPYYAGLVNCGAAILSNTWILTAAHCVENVKPSPRNYVWVGGETFQNSIRVPYGQIYIHKDYRSVQGLPIHDVALLRLSTPLQFSSKIQPVQLPKGLHASRQVVFVGRGKDESGRISNVLKTVKLVKLSAQECVSRLPREYQSFAQRNLALFEKINICATREENMPSICSGDSGSPLMSGNSLVGLASYIGKECSKVRLGFYVNVVNYLPWIKAITGL